MDVHLGNEFISGNNVCLDILEQFPQYQHLPISSIKNGGIDNYTFRLGKEYIVKYPKKRCYASQPVKEHKWLPVIASKINSTNIPKPKALGTPTKFFQHHWTINTWIEGETLSESEKSLTKTQLNQLSIDIAQFLKELHKASIENAPKAGEHNFHRGGSLKENYDKDMREYINYYRLKPVVW